MCRKTIPQAKCPLWKKERDKRLTPTKSHAIFNAFNAYKKPTKKRPALEPEELDAKLIELFQQKNTLKKSKLKKSELPALKYGTDNENDARQKYRDVTGTHAPHPVVFLFDIEKFI